MKQPIHKIIALVFLIIIFASFSAFGAIDATGLPSLHTLSTQETLQTLSRDTDNAHKALGKIFDKKKVEEQQELAKVFGEEAFKLVGDISKKLDWKDGSTEKIILHGIVAAVQANWGGGNTAIGGLAGMTNEAMIPLIAEQLEKNGVKKGTKEFESLMQIASTVVGSAVGLTVSGNTNGMMTGGAVALTATQNNYLKHYEVKAMDKELAKCKAGDDKCRQDTIDKYQQISDQHDEEMRSCATQACINWHQTEIANAQPELNKLATRDSVAGDIVAKWQKEEERRSYELTGGEDASQYGLKPSGNYNAELDAHCLNGDGAFCSKALQDSLNSCTGTECQNVADWLRQRSNESGCASSASSESCQGLTKMQQFAQTKAQALEGAISPFDIIGPAIVEGLAIKGAALFTGMTRVIGKDAISVAEKELGTTAGKAVVDETAELAVKAGTTKPADIAVRQAYVNEVQGLSNLEQNLIAEGKNVEEVARAMYEARRELGIKYKDMTSPEMLEEIYARNLEQYGDKLGPSIDWLRNTANKSWQEIIESAKTSGKEFNKRAGIK